jgi:hypothetical protein
LSHTAIEPATLLIAHNTPSPHNSHDHRTFAITKSGDYEKL